MGVRFTDTSSASAAFEIRPDYQPTTPGIEQAQVQVTGSYPVVDPQAIESAVYGYIAAIRALGRTSVNTAEIAAALELPRQVVEGTLEALQARHVKIAP